MPNVKFVVEHQVVEVSAGRTLREVALEAGVYPNREWFRGFNCGGRGLCGTCTVWVKAASASATNKANLRERLHGLGDGRRLACQTLVLGDLEVVTFPGGDDRTTAGRHIDPAPVRPEGTLEGAKAAQEALKEAGEKKGAKAAPGDQPKAPDKSEKAPAEKKPPKPKPTEGGSPADAAAANAEAPAGNPPEDKADAAG